MKSFKRFFPIALILLLMIGAYGSGILHFFRLEEFKYHYSLILNGIEHYPIATTFAYLATYILITACSLPIALFMTLLAGILFQQPYATLYADIGMTFGSCISFLAAKYAIGDSLKIKALPFIAKTEAGFKENAFTYMLFLRMVPIFPYQMINLAPAVLNVSFKAFFLGFYPRIHPPRICFYASRFRDRRSPQRIKRYYFGCVSSKRCTNRLNCSWDICFNTDFI